MGHIHKGTITGKLKGVIPTHTPSGTRSTVLSIPTPLWSSVRQNELLTAICGSVLPIISVGAAHANSTQSIPRRTSPRASPIVFPCSFTISSASSSKCSSSTCLYLNMNWQRSPTGLLDHAGNASAAAATASSALRVSSIDTCASISPVAGLVTARVADAF
jgi:hypothetical protein